MGGERKQWTGYYYKKWLIQYINGFYRQAEKTLRELLYTLPEDGSLHGNLALVLLKEGDLDKALVEANKALGLDPYNPGILRIAAGICEASGCHDSAVELAKKILSFEPHDLYARIIIDRFSEGSNSSNDKIFVRPLRITYLLATTGLTGGAKIIFEHVNRLIDRGHIVYVVSHMGQPDWFPLNTRVIQVPKGMTLASYVPNSDVVVATFWTHAFEALSVPHAIPLYFVQGDEALFQDPEVSSQFLRISDESYRLPMRLLTVSNAVRLILKTRYNRRSDVLPNAVDRNIFYPRPRELRKRKKILIVGPDQLRFKGIPEIYQALSRVRRFRREWGKDDFEVVRVSQAPRVDFSMPVTWIQRPPQSELGRIYADCDIFVSGSHYEAFSLPPLEAMASGTPVVITDNEGVREYAQDGYNCLMVPVGDIEAMAKAIMALLDDEDLARRLAENGLKTATEYDWDNIIDQLENLLYELALDIPPIVSVSWLRTAFPIPAKSG